MNNSDSQNSLGSSLHTKGYYGNLDSCTIYVDRAATLDVKAFQTESGYDTLEINDI